MNITDNLRFMAGAILLTAATTSCLFEEPDMTSDGEPGIDPTAVVLNTDISLTLTLPSFTDGYAPYVQPATAGTDYRRRVTVAAVADGFPTVTRTVITDTEPGEHALTTSLSMRLHAREYRLMVWSDYVRVSDGDIDSTYFYNLAKLPNVYMSTAYHGCDDYKDAACACVPLDLSAYQGELNSKVSLELSLTRPVGRLQLVTDDTCRFLDRIASGEVKGNSFTVRVSYPGYLSMGYNIETGLPRHNLMYMKFDRKLNASALTADEPYTIAFDYLMGGADTPAEIPVKVELLDSEATSVLATTVFNAYVLAGAVTTVSHNFLTALPGEGVDFDTEFSGSETVVIPVLPD